MKTRKLLFMGLLFVLVLTACGGKSSGSDPVGVAKDFVKAMEKLDIEAASKLVCKERQADYDVKTAFAELEDMGMDPDELLGAIKLDMKDMKYEEKSIDGDNAVVHLTGNIAVDFDEDKLKSFLKKSAEAAGQTVTDADLDMMMGFFTAMGGQETPFDGDVQMVKEGGKWLICDELNFMDAVDLGF